MKNRRVFRWLAMALCLMMLLGGAAQAACAGSADCESGLNLRAVRLSDGRIRVTWNAEACASQIAVVRLERGGRLAACQWARACAGECVLTAGKGEYRVRVSLCVKGEGRVSCETAVCGSGASETPAPTVTPEPTKAPAVTATPSPTVTPEPTEAPRASLAEQVIAQVNRERAAYGLGALSTSEELNRAACVRAKEIVSTFSHTRPDGSSCFTVSALAFGENIARGYTTADRVMAAWMSSQGHRENILRESFGSIGVCAYSQGGVIYWVQLFGK